MEVCKERFQDVGEKDENGYYDYAYTGVLYRFVDGKEGIVAMQYDDTPTEVSFKGYESKTRRGWKRRGFDVLPYENPAFREAVKYLVAKENVQSITVLLGEYVPVDVKQILG